MLHWTRLDSSFFIKKKLYPKKIEGNTHKNKRNKNDLWQIDLLDWTRAKKQKLLYKHNTTLFKRLHNRFVDKKWTSKQITLQKLYYRIKLDGSSSCLIVMVTVICQKKIIVIINFYPILLSNPTENSNSTQKTCND